MILSENPRQYHLCHHEGSAFFDPASPFQSGKALILIL